METIRQPLVTNSVQPYLAEVRLFGDFLLHSHDEMELVLLLSGRAVYTIDGVEYEMQAGDLVLVAPNLIHTITLPDGARTVSGLLLECGYAMFGDDYELLRGNTFVSPVMHVLEPDCPAAERLGSILRAILRELPPLCGLPEPVMTWVEIDTAPHTARDCAVRSLLLELFVWLTRSIPMKPVQDGRLTQAQKLRWSNVFDYIAAHYHEPIRVEQAAALSGYSVYHFSRCFREYTGFSFHRYLNRYRVEKAVLLLADRSTPVTRIAEQAGFESIKTFNRVFRQETGESPTSFRAIAQRQSARGTDDRS